MKFHVRCSKKHPSPSRSPKKPRFSIVDFWMKIWFLKDENLIFEECAARSHPNGSAGDHSRLFFRLLSQIGFPIQPTQIRSNGDQGWSPALTMRYPSSKKSAKIENRADFSIFWLTLCEAGLNAAENKKIRDYFLIPHRSVVQDRDNSSSIKRKLRLKLILMIIPGMYKFF